MFLREELDNLQSLELKHLSLLEQMQEAGNQIAARWNRIYLELDNQQLLNLILLKTDCLKSSIEETIFSVTRRSRFRSDVDH